MKNESPFACVMEAIEADRRAPHIENAKRLFSNVSEIRELVNGYSFCLSNDAGVLSSLAEFISLEKLCCPFLGFTVTVEPEGGDIWLELTGREGVKTFIQAEISEILGSAYPVTKGLVRFMIRLLVITTLILAFVGSSALRAQRYSTADGKLRIALVKQPYSPNGISAGPNTMANGGIQQMLTKLDAVVRLEEAKLTVDEATEYGGWKKLGMALGHFAEIVEKNEREGYFTVGLLATCPSMPGLVAGLQHSGPTREPIKIGMLWLDAHPDFNTPETTRSGSLGGMPVAVATGRALQRMRLDAHLDPPLSDRHVVMAGVRLTDPLEQSLLDQSAIEQLSVDDLRNLTPAVWAQLDRLNQLTDKIYIHIDMDVLDPKEVMGHGNKVPNGPSSAQLARLFEEIFRRYPKASAIGFATIPSTDEGGHSIAALNRMVEGAVRGLKAREGRK